MCRNSRMSLSLSLTKYVALPLTHAPARTYTHIHAHTGKQYRLGDLIVGLAPVTHGGDVGRVAAEIKHVQVHVPGCSSSTTSSSSCSDTGAGAVLARMDSLVSSLLAAVGATAFSVNPLLTHTCAHALGHTYTPYTQTHTIAHIRKYSPHTHAAINLSTNTDYSTATPPRRTCKSTDYPSWRRRQPR